MVCGLWDGGVGIFEILRGRMRGGGGGGVVLEKWLQFIGGYSHDRIWTLFISLCICGLVLVGEVSRG